MTVMQFKLYLQANGEFCRFRLTWGEGQSIAAEVAYPIDVFQCYDVWKDDYLKYYRSFRARGVVSGTGQLPTDLRAMLVKADKALLEAFKIWLAQAELMPIRVELMKAARLGITDLLIICETSDFDRLPWETWAESPEFSRGLRISRIPTRIGSPVGTKVTRSKLRILVILGDETGLNFTAERSALKKLQRNAFVDFVGWQGGQDVTLRSRIRAALVDEQGWDLLIFAGHSNETALTGGELGIAPRESLMLSEIEKDLKVAIDRGLQFAIFNSCNGLSIAQKLIDAGLSQVIIMREPIHNRVAQTFLLDFLQQFITGLDVHAAMRLATQALEDDPNLDCPASQWVPSLFRHPAAPLFQCPPIDRLQWLKQWKPDRWEAGVIGSLAVLSLFNSVQDSLMNTRQGVQTIYRMVTNQVPQDNPKIQLVTIDQASLDQARINRRQPMDWNYLSQVLDRVSTYQPKVVGLDFSLDEPEAHPAEHVNLLKRSLQRFANQPFVFSSFLEDTQDAKEIKVSPTLVTQRVVSGYTDTDDWFLPLFNSGDPCIVSCPFASRMANFSSPVIRSVHPVTDFSRNFGQFWFHPIQDFSIPADRIYQTISAKDLGKLDRSALNNQIVLIVANYPEAGLDGYNKDYTSNVPLAVQWGTPLDRPSPQVFTGGEHLAYSIHHFMKRHFVIPVPDLWMVLIAGTIAKLFQIRGYGRSRHKWLWTSFSILGYGILGLQLYLSAKLLLPFFLPSLTLFLLVFPKFRQVNR